MHVYERVVREAACASPSSEVARRGVRDSQVNSARSRCRRTPVDADVSPAHSSTARYKPWRRSASCHGKTSVSTIRSTPSTGALNRAHHFV